MTALNDPRIKLRHLQAFASVAREHTVQQAAEVLSLTASAISKALHELEAIVERPLFKRTRKGLIATVEGEQLLRHVLPALGLLRDGLNLAAGRQQKTGVYQVRVGVLPTTASAIVPQAVQKIQSRYERLEIRVIAGTNLQLLNLLREGELDMVVGRLPEPTLMFGLSFETLYSEPMVLVSAPSHPLAGRASVAVADLVPHVVVLPLADTIIRKTVDTFFLASGLASLPRTVETLSESFARTLALGGDAIWFCPLGTVKRDLDEHTLVRLPIDTQSTSGAVGLSLRADVELSKSALLMAEMIRTQARLWRQD
ncbi:MAG: pca operon transcription factor PcaQ [Pseudomonadota bacterium]